MSTPTQYEVSIAWDRNTNGAIKAMRSDGIQIDEKVNNQKVLISAKPFEIEDLAESNGITGIEPVENDEETETESHIDVRNEEAKSLDQMQEIKRRTIRDGLLELDVDRVTTATNSQKWVVILNHPFLDELKFYFDKPTTGWSDEYKIARVLKSYSIMSGNPYKLQTMDVYAEFTGDDPEIDSNWEIREQDNVLDEIHKDREYSPDTEDEDSDPIGIRLIESITG